MEFNIDNLLASNHAIKLESSDDSIRIIESGLPGMIFTLNEIGESFFDLKNGVLGGTFQRLVNYRYPIAIVLPHNHNFGTRVTELAREHSSHGYIRFCSSIEDAKKWMIDTLKE